MTATLQKNRFLALLALYACLLALIIIGLGAFTRLIDAGLGCPDWPGCYGKLLVPSTQDAQHLAALQFPQTPLVSYKAWAEMIHRYAVGGLSLLCLSVIIFAIKTRRRANIFLAACLLLLLTYQILLGQLTVTLKLLPFIVTQHLLGGLLVLTTLWLIFLSNKANWSIRQKNDAIRKISWPALLALIILLAQIILGAWTSTHYAALSCPDFPFCSTDNMSWHFQEAFNLSPAGINYEGGTLPTPARQTIHMMHRIGALVVSIYFLGFILFLLLRFKNSLDISGNALLILSALCAQISLGMSNILFKLPLIVAIAHNIVAALLLVAVTTLIFKTLFKPTTS